MLFLTERGVVYATELVCVMSDRAHHLTLCGIVSHITSGANGFLGSALHAGREGPGFEPHAGHFSLQGEHFLCLFMADLFHTVFCADYLYLWCKKLRYLFVLPPLSMRSPPQNWRSSCLRTLGWSEQLHD